MALPGSHQIVKIFQILAMLAIMLLPPAIMAKTPKVVTDIPTTHSLVASVMGELGEPVLLMQSNASPHDYALRPGDAASLESANIIFWTSAELTPWLIRAASSLAQDARSIELMKTAGTTTLAFRDSATHGQNQDEANQHHTHNHNEHSSGGIDPHGWLDPVNAQLWLELIVSELSLIDPDNAPIYKSNAAAEIEKINRLMTTVTDQLGTTQHRSFIVFHDSFHYFEDRFNLHSVAAISLSDGEHPSIRRLNTLRSILANYPGTCVFAEPQFSDRLIKTITSGQDVKRGLLDPLGALQSPGPALYRNVIKELANGFSSCLNKP